MISDARGGHVSPGVYTEEREVTYSVKSLGITNLGLAGETVKGPAFQAIPIESWGDFTDYFGGTSIKKFKGNNLPKYELPYIAKSYLQESKKLQVVRILGLSGYINGSAFVISAEFDNGVEKKKYPVVVLRSKIMYNGDITGCQENKYEEVTSIVDDIQLAPYSGTSFGSLCEILSADTYSYPTSGIVVGEDGAKYVAASETNSLEIGKFGLVMTTVTGSASTVMNVSLNYNDDDYIYARIPSDPLEKKDCPIYIESVFDYSYLNLVEAAESGTLVTFTIDKCDSFNDFREPFRCAETPWIVSQVATAGSNGIELKKLFKFFTISDGDAANRQVKISIENIRPIEGTFDVVVRDFDDTDMAPIVLEKYLKCCLREGESNFIGLKIGTFDGGYEAKSKYITVMLSENTEGLEKYVPAGFLGYPVPNYCIEDNYENVNMCYNTAFKNDSVIKPKKQYFGLNDETLDIDILNYKGVAAYDNGGYDFDPEKLTNGFHLDAILSEEVYKFSGSTLANAEILVDGVSGFKFTTVDYDQAGTKYTNIPRIVAGSYMDKTIYSDIRVRKFTVYPYGGFDGWDIFRDERTNTDGFKGNKYEIPDTEKGKEKCPFKKIASGEGDLNLNVTLNLNLPSTAISSDYYAYLAGYKQFANPQDIDINLFSTPGINWMDNNYLTEDALDIIEDAEDGRGGDALYIITTPQYDSDGYTYTEEDIASQLEEKEVSSSYACTYWPWVKYYDSTSKTYINLPATKDVVRNMAYTDNHLYPWYAPAGTSRGSVECVKAFKKTTLSSEDTLYSACVNPVKTFAEDGVLVWGNKTLYNNDSPLNRVNVRRLMIRIKKLVVNASKELIFEQYDSTLEKQFKSIVDPILKNVQDNRGISDYRLVTECTPETRDQHILPAKILVKPINALEYISISFVVYPESVEFDETL